MSFLSWNCCGLGNPRNIQFLKEIISQKKPNFIFLCETKSVKTRLEWLKIQLGFEGLLVVDFHGRSGGLALFWLWQSEVRITGFSFNHIDAVIDRDGESTWRFTGIYGEPNRAFRDRTWNLLRRLAVLSSLPWCVMGDLNNIAHASNQRGGRPYPSSLIQVFQQSLIDCDLCDLDLHGHQFTWERSRGTSNWIESRLERCLINTSWLVIFSTTTLHNLDISSSNQRSSLLQPSPCSMMQRRHKFRFENAWLRDPMCLH